MLRYRPAFAMRMQKPVKIASLVFLVAIVSAAIAKDWHTLVAYAPAIGSAVLAFNLLSLLVGYGVPRLVGLPRPQAVAIGMEIGIHNATLAITVALSPQLLNDATIAIPAGIYGVLMFFTAAAFAWLVNRRRAAPAI